MVTQYAALITAGFAAGILLASFTAYALFRKTTHSPESMLRQIHEKVEGLSHIFSVPRYRGQAGEWMLEQLLQDCLPPHAFRIQHTFHNGNRVDALLSLGPVNVAVDAKFPLEALGDWREGELGGKAQKAVLQHASAIADKYICPDEGTLNFAIMYIPSEGIYSRLFAENPALLLRACMQIGVVPASPSNLFLYLQTIAYGLRGMDFSQNFTKYAALFELIRQETRQLFDVLNTGNTHLRNSQRNFDTALQKTRDMQRNLDESLDQA